jgi:hypothetical protein
MDMSLGRVPRIRVSEFSSTNGGSPDFRMWGSPWNEDNRTVHPVAGDAQESGQQTPQPHLSIGFRLSVARPLHGALDVEDGGKPIAAFMVPVRLTRDRLLSLISTVKRHAILCELFPRREGGLI